jgi:O-antigen/teichoic acid export membrane protein
VAFFAGTFVLYRGAGPLGLAVSQLAAHGALLAVAVAFLTRSHDFHPRLPGWARIRGFLAESAPTGLYMFASLGSWRLGIIWLAAAPGAGPAVAGIFAAAHRVIESARFFPAAAAAALFPSFARPKPEAHPRRILLTIMGPIVLGTFFISLPAVTGPMVRLMFGAAYDSAAPLLTVLWWAFPFMTMNWVLSHWMVARGHEKANSGLALIQSAAHAGLLFFLIPTYGALGASYSLLISEATFSISSLLFLVIRK